MADLQIAAGGRELLAQSIRDIQSSTAATQGEVERLSAALQAATGRLDQVDAVLAQRRQQALRAEAVVLAVGQLRAALRGSKPFAPEIAALRAVADNDKQFDAALGQVAPAADTGVCRRATSCAAASPTSRPKSSAAPLSGTGRSGGARRSTVSNR